MSNNNIKDDNRLTTRYRIVLQQEDDNKEVWSGKTSRLQVILLICLFVAIIGGGMFALFAWTPLHNILPGYLHRETRIQIIDNAIRLDSLTRQMQLRDQYMENIARILNDEIAVDSITLNDSIAASLDSVTKWTPDILSKSSPESEAFAQEYEKNERFNLTMLPSLSEGILFHTPLTGKIIKTYNPQQGSYGIEIETTRNTAVSAVLDGSIVAITHTIANGYVVVVQHNNNFISIYRNVGECLRKVGDKVNAGQRIALVGTATNNIAQFELWYAGTAINPQQYIVF
ncbi:MAG: M23 family metallopeptidase [Bacteroidaceae bacterium]|nr:M23 family metallopeptidase [Bacteroidaceae bacterium]MBQ5776400.1 M23 family metallopeptidase [Bacteroidaceae bacterium]